MTTIFLIIGILIFAGRLLVSLVDAGRLLVSLVDTGRRPRQ